MWYHAISIDICVARCVTTSLHVSCLYESSSSAVPIDGVFEVCPLLLLLFSLLQFALENLRKSGVEITLNSRVIGASEHSVKLKDGNVIPTYIFI
jgi:hypothetical protein